MGESYIDSRWLLEEGEGVIHIMLAHWLPGKLTEGHMPLISYHGGDNSDLKIEKITSWGGAGD